MSLTDPRTIANEIKGINRESVEATVWYSPGRDRDGDLIPKTFSYISCEITPCDSSNVLNEILKEHNLVIREAFAGTDGMRFTLTYEGLMHGDEPVGGDE